MIGEPSLLETIQNRLVRLGCIRFRDGAPPKPHIRDLADWAIILYEQAADLHREVFDDSTTTANELRLSRQLINVQMTLMMALTKTAPASRLGPEYKDA